MRRSSCTIYVGNLPGDIRESEIEDLFEKYGPIVDIDLKLPPRPPGYCFIQFEDYRDAEDAIRGRDGYKFDGYRLRVEPAHGGRGSSVDTYGSYGGGGYSTSSYRRSRYRVVVYGLPSSASWQDLKDHMRRAGDVCFAQVYREGRDTIGVVEYTTYDDMRYAIKRLDDSEFRNPFSRSYIRVKEDRGYSRGRSYSRSPSYDYYRKGYRGRSYSRSYSRSPSYDSRRSPSQSYSRSPSVYSHSRSPSRSVSRSPVPLRPSKRSSYARSISPSRSPSISRSKSRSHKKSLSRRSRSRSMSRSPSPSGPYYRSRSRSYSPPRRLLDDVRRRSPSSD